MLKIKNLFFINNFWQLLVFFIFGINALLIFSSNTVLFFSLFIIFFFLIGKTLDSLLFFFKKKKKKIFLMFDNELRELISRLTTANKILKSITKLPLIIKVYTKFFNNYYFFYGFILRSKTSSYFFLFLKKRILFFRNKNKLNSKFNFSSNHLKKNYLIFLTSRL